jgi:acetoin utilization deacetylase AcuC-like enzyme
MWQAHCTLPGSAAMSLAYLTHASSLKHAMGTGHPECPARLQVIQDRLLAEGLMDGLTQHDAPAASIQQILRVHPEHHLNGLMAVAPTEGMVHLDPDTAMNPFTLTAALHAAGAVVHGVNLVMSGQARRAFCAVRPPGHHAERHRAMGFCFFNNLAVGAAHAMAEYGVQRVALIDFDVHHGNGTEDIFAGDERVLMLSTFQTELYPFLGDVPKGPNMVNVPLKRYTDGKAMRAAVIEHWLPALAAFQPELIMISAGFDAHRADDMAQLGWQDADYRWLTHVLSDAADRWCAGRIVSTLEGGYDLDALARSVALHVRVLADLDSPMAELPPLPDSASSAVLASAAARRTPIRPTITPAA